MRKIKKEKKEEIKTKLRKEGKLIEEPTEITPEE